MEHTEDDARILERMTTAREIMKLQIVAIDMQGKINDAIKLIREKTPGLCDAIENLQGAPLYDYIKALEQIHGSIWCHECNSNKLHSSGAASVPKRENVLERAPESVFTSAPESDTRQTILKLSNKMDFKTRALLAYEIIDTLRTDLDAVCELERANSVKKDEQCDKAPSIPKPAQNVSIPAAIDQGADDKAEIQRVYDMATSALNISTLITTDDLLA